MSTSAELLATAAKRLYPNYKPAAMVLARGRGCELFDVDGRRWLDLCAGVAVCSVGHAHPKLVKAISEQAARVMHVSNYFYNEENIRLADELCEKSGMARAMFCNSGAEANEAAIKVARKATGRPRILALEGGFHGRTLGALSATGQPGKWEGFGPLLPGVVFARPNDLESLRAAADPGDDLAVVIVEPILGEGGVIPLDGDFARAAAAIAREAGALLCVDEVQAGLGRTGTFFAHEQLGIEPDLVTLAKGLANGLPIGALLVRDGKAPTIGPGDHGSTFGGNPVACAAACAVVEAIDDALLANVVARGTHLAGGLRGLPAVREVRGRGLLLGAVLDRAAAPVVDACRERGLLVLTAGADVLRLLPPLVVTEAEVDEALAILGAVLR
jgi:acetylornithine/N-succinyldiaminopimelate aminotransferase